MKSEKVFDFSLKSNLPFDFRYSYSETNPSIEPIGYREHRDSLPLDLDSSTGNGPALMLWPKKRLICYR
ncbi:unnamed protein product [Camellia sinensis]